MFHSKCLNEYDFRLYKQPLLMLTITQLITLSMFVMLVNTPNTVYEISKDGLV